MNTLDMFSLKGKIALVTGGAGLYGRQIVSGCAEAGADTYIASRNLAQKMNLVFWKEFENEGYELVAYGMTLKKYQENNIRSW